MYLGNLEVKVFTSSMHSRVERDVNSFFRQNPDLKLIDQRVTEDDRNYTVTLFLERTK